MLVDAIISNFSVDEGLSWLVDAVMSTSPSRRVSALVGAVIHPDPGNTSASVGVVVPCFTPRFN